MHYNSHTRIIALVLIPLMLAACSRAVEIPREEIALDRYREPGSYRIKLHGWNEYNARRFSMTDSTVVIEELLKTDDRYELKKHEMPIVVPLRDVEYIGVMKTNLGVTTAVLVGLGAFVVLVYWLGQGLEGLEGS